MGGQHFSCLLGMLLKISYITARSDGLQPHLINIQFQRKVELTVGRVLTQHC